MIFVQISEKVYFVGQECKNHLHGRILLIEESLTLLDICKKLNVVWKHLGQWKAIQMVL